MARHLSQIVFPDGTFRFSSYSTVTETLVGQLYRAMVDTGDRASSGPIADRAQPDGEPDPRFEAMELATVSEILPVTVTILGDDRRWSALYCPNKRRLLGPLSPHVVFHIHEGFELTSDVDGLLHLFPVHHTVASTTAVCGVQAAADPISFHWEYDYPGNPNKDQPRPTTRDLYTEWNTGLICRSCLLDETVIAAGHR